VSAVLYSLFPVASALVAAACAVIFQKSDRVRCFMQHLAAGVVVAAVTVELVPDLMHRRSPISTALGFSLAVLVLVALKRMEDNTDNAVPAVPKTYIAATGIDLLLDGFVIAIGFAAGAKQGKLLTVALTLELASLGLALIGELLGRQLSRWKAFTITAGVSCLLLIGSAVGAMILKHLSPSLLTAALGFGVAALLFLVTEELLLEAHKQEDTSTTTVIFFAGFLSILILDMVSG
jgi:ZIP family zinc transporter